MSTDEQSSKQQQRRGVQSSGKLYRFIRPFGCFGKSRNMDSGVGGGAVDGDDMKRSSSTGSGRFFRSSKTGGTNTEDVHNKMASVRRKKYGKVPGTVVVSLNVLRCAEVNSFCIILKKLVCNSCSCLPTSCTFTR